MGVGMVWESGASEGTGNKEEEEEIKEFLWPQYTGTLYIPYYIVLYNYHNHNLRCPGHVSIIAVL